MRSNRDDRKEGDEGRGRGHDAKEPDAARRDWCATLRDLTPTNTPKLGRFAKTASTRHKSPQQSIRWGRFMSEHDTQQSGHHHGVPTKVETDRNTQLIDRARAREIQIRRWSYLIIPLIGIFIVFITVAKNLLNLPGWVLLIAISIFIFLMIRGWHAVTMAERQTLFPPPHILARGRIKLVISATSYVLLVTYALGKVHNQSFWFWFAMAVGLSIALYLRQRILSPWISRETQNTPLRSKAIANTSLWTALIVTSLISAAIGGWFTVDIPDSDALSQSLKYILASSNDLNDISSLLSLLINILSVIEGAFLYLIAYIALLVGGWVWIIWYAMVSTVVIFVIYAILLGTEQFALQLIQGEKQDDEQPDTPSLLQIVLSVFFGLAVFFSIIHIIAALSHAKTTFQKKAISNMNITAECSEEDLKRSSQYLLDNKEILESAEKDSLDSAHQLVEDIIHSDAIAQAVNQYLDWEFGYLTDYIVVATAVTGDMVGNLISEKLNETIFNSLNRQSLPQQIELLIRTKIGQRLQSQPQSIRLDCITNNIFNTQDMVPSMTNRFVHIAGAAASALTVALGIAKKKAFANIAAKIMAKIAAKGGAKLLTKAGTSLAAIVPCAATGPLAPVCAVAVGIGTFVATDALITKGDELLHRDERYKEIMSILQNELDNALSTSIKAVFRDIDQKITEIEKNKTSGKHRPYLDLL